MESITWNEKINQYVANRLSGNDKADFEAEMMMDKELEKEVAHQILRKMQIDYKVKEHIQKAELERVMVNEAIEAPKKSLTRLIRQQWGRLLGSMSSN